MVDTRATDHRVRLGTWGISDITSTYAIENWTVQTDQQQDNQTVIPWIGPIASVDEFPVYARYARSADNRLRGDGFLSFTLVMSLWTFDQVKYVDDTFYAGGTLDYADVSVMVYDRNNDPVFLTCTADRPDLKSADPVYGGYQNIPWNFHTGTLIGATTGFTASITEAGDTLAATMTVV